jgi:RND family efflux transporter MFP subunit
VAPSAPPPLAPLVRVIEVQPERVRYAVRAHGTVVPRTESDLVPQVSGEVEWVSPNFVSGGFFEEGEPLVRLERSDARLEVASASAAVASARSEFERADTELRRQRVLREQGVASQARIDDAENGQRVAEARLREARARLDRARRDLERTELRAPFPGRVRSERVDVGQFVSRGQSIATLYAVDFAEVRLPVPDRELQFLALDLDHRGGGGAGDGPEVRLHAEFAGRDRTWSGRIVRTEGEIDGKSRMVNLVARVEDPYGVHAAEPRSPLAVGLFVEAEILGREVEGVFVLPRAALRPASDEAPDRVLVVDAESRLRVRPVEVLRTEREQVLIGAGLAEGERIAVTPLQAVVDGMAARVAGAGAEDEAPETTASVGENAS